jgi:hypothetical protein
MTTIWGIIKAVPGICPGTTSRICVILHEYGHDLAQGDVGAHPTHYWRKYAKNGSTS